MATTQFESVDARRSFPCFDEPDRKAVFEVTMIVDRDLDAISNSPIVSVDTVDGKQRIRFAPTMKMSTYLVAFVVGKLEMTETVDVDGVPLRVVCTPGKLPLAEFALEIGVFALRFFTEYFNIPYPGDKVDLVAIPDFAAGAMENLGCSRSGTPPSWSTRTRRPAPSSSVWPTSSRMSWRTCGSATS